MKGQIALSSECVTLPPTEETHDSIRPTWLVVVALIDEGLDDKEELTTTIF